MARKPGPGICVHCLKTVSTRNWDHVFPQAWYPDSTPMNLEKWKIPTCKPCNDEYGRIEEDLGIILSACVDPKSARAAGIWAKRLRALDASRGATEKDRRARARKREWLLSMITTGDHIPNHGIYPGLGERWGRPREQQVALCVSARHLQKMAEKIVKGLAFIEDSRLIDSNTQIQHHVIDDVGARPMFEALTTFGAAYSRGPGIEVVRAVTPEDGVSALYKIIIWGEIKLYVSVLRNVAQPVAPGDAPESGAPLS